MRVRVRVCVLTYLHVHKQARLFIKLSYGDVVTASVMSTFTSGRGINVQSMCIQHCIPVGLCPHISGGADSKYSHLKLTAKYDLEFDPTIPSLQCIGVVGSGRATVRGNFSAEAFY